MKDMLIAAAVFALAIALVFGIAYSMRLFSNATTPLVLHNPKPGITCASMVTSDGAALSYWKEGAME
jgi:hypothetical protein